jgi:hypothetical protein
LRGWPPQGQVPTLNSALRCRPSLIRGRWPFAMFLGHYALAFAAKRIAPRASLGMLIAAAQFLDLLWPIFLILGVEQVAPGDQHFTALRFTHYPWSHSLAMTLVWSALLGLAYARVTDDRWSATVIGLLVSSHWVLDLVVHRPDLPLYPGGSARLGFGLWNSVLGTIVVEAVLFIAGIVVYTTSTRARDRIGRYAWWSLVAALAVTYAADVFGPPPTNMTALAWTALLLWIIPVWGWWADSHRMAVTP